VELVDGSPVSEGYNSDVTRSIVFGQPFADNGEQNNSKFS
jgi:Xaa-Pro aminopeptidase